LPEGAIASATIDSFLHEWEITYQGGTDNNDVLLTNLQVTQIPEPASLAVWTLIGLGLTGFGFRRSRGKK